MFHTGLQRIKNSEISTFTSDIGIKLRKLIHPIWGPTLKLCTSRKVIVLHVEIHIVFSGSVDRVLKLGFGKIIQSIVMIKFSLLMVFGFIKFLLSVVFGLLWYKYYSWLSEFCDAE